MDNYSYLATKRTSSIFAPDVEQNFKELEKVISNSSILVVGAAGSIGGAVTKKLISFKPKKISLVDVSENGLVEVVRDIRAGNIDLKNVELDSLPIAMGSREFDVYVNKNHFDYVLNLSALKHVRSEKNIFTIAHMYDVNVRFINNWLERKKGSYKKFFSVSSDKSVSPSNLMGASKHIMEKVMAYHSDKQPFTSSRFANVAFSYGSLLEGFLMRIEKHQPLAAPNDIRRFFISFEEAAELCLLACFKGENADIYIPKIDEGVVHERRFDEIAIDLLEKKGFKPELCQSELEAKEKIALIKEGRYPCYFSSSDTTGEKEYEEFYASTEIVRNDLYKNISVVKTSMSKEETIRIEKFLHFLNNCNLEETTKADFVKEVAKVVPTLFHEERGKNLDEKM
jgi:FlaA1/EpsC-like NDP-sugar epimerase